MEETEKDSGRDMTPRLIGETYMKYPNERSRQRYKYGLYKCAYCGKEFETKFASIKGGTTKSCGCQKGKGNITHGLGLHRFYDTWRQMLQRCNNPKYKDYKDYGARGITVCEEWLDVRNFVSWAEQTHPNIEGLSLDRIDVDGNYEPNNCRWADASTQALNQRMKGNNTSGFVGVAYRKDNNKWSASITIDCKVVFLRCFKTKEEAVEARDNYIIQNNLPHKLSSDYNKD